MRIPLATCVSYVETKLTDIPVPDWTPLDVTSEGTIILDFSQIYIDDEDGNKTKVDTHTGEEIETLKNSFAEGVELNEFPPAVKFRGNNYDKPYVLVYGYGRTEALQELQQKRWFFTLLNGNEDGITDVQAQENEGALPKRINKEVDMRLFLISKIKDGIIENTSDAIVKKFKKVYPNRDKSVMNRIVQQVMEQTNTPQPFRIFTSTPRIRQWFENHSSEQYSIEGEYDAVRDMYGVHIKEGYQYRVVISAIERYSKTGKFTYVIGHFSAPTKKATLHSKRIKFQQEFDRIKTALESCGLSIWPIVIMGYFPQDKEKENAKVLVKPVVVPKTPTVFDPNLLEPIDLDLEEMMEL